MINMVGRIVTAVALVLGAPATVLYLAPGAGLDPAWVVALIAGIFLIAAVWLWRCHSSFLTRAGRRPSRPRKN
ncbi:hypothetical protein [Streptosporangium lutulentum]|uniref:Uncharacterized protein n=1 Tax=Streptosporangium lutulentum TaxID=1461250 RepID=A0ABT9QU31_9ACTN|nr:hypothetical protein [Streptosporangium lutulentum]MDP9850260.1 hypothetical protein [Streptosporangium lutulentum]